MSENSNRIVLELNQISQNRAIDNLLTDSIEELVDLIFKRIEQAKSKKESFNEDSKEYYELSKEHDSILIDGTRGTGKTTVIRNINNYLLKVDDIERYNQIKIVPIIDPNHIDNSANILSIIIRIIFDTVKEDKSRNRKTNEFGKICELKDEIEDVIFSASQQKYKTSRESSKTVKGEMDLDFTIHKFACEVCKFFEVDALVLPIDDIDMAIEHGSSIVETLRRYMQTPKIIPIIALDSAQIYALIKKEYFSKFGFEASTPLHEIDSSSELNFLQKLPSEYIQKILPPSQRVMLPDMLGHYKNHLEAKLNKKSKKKEIWFKFTKEHNREWEIEWSFDDLLKVLMNILFGYDGKEILNGDDYHIVNYLKNKTFRSFLDDVKALMRAMEQNEKNKNIYTVNMQVLKNRFKMPSRTTASNKYDATLWFWKRYVEKLYSNLEEFREKKELFKNDYFKLDLVEDILTVTPEDAKDLGRKEKIYYRLYMQDYFIRKITIIYSKNELSVKKEINIFGLVELILRTLFPALMFEHFNNHRFISLDSFPIEKLTEFSNTDVHTSLIELYDNSIPSWVEKYGSKKIIKNNTDKSYRQICILNKVIESDKKDILHYKSFYDFKEYKQKYYLHPYKFWAFFSEMDKHIKDFKKYGLNLILSKYIHKSLKNEITATENNKKYNKTFNMFKEGDIYSDFYDANIGILSWIKIVDQIVKNLSIINTNIIDFSYFKEQIADITVDLSIEELNFLYRKEIDRYLALMESVFLNGFIIYFLTKGNISKKSQKVEDDYIISGTYSNDLFKFAIIDNVFLRNLKLIMEIDNPHIQNIKKFIFAYIDINSGNVKKLYIFDDNIVDMFKEITGTQKYTSKEEAIRKKTDEILEKIDTYLKLFKNFINKDFNYGEILNAINSSNKTKIYAKVADAVNELGVNKIENNIEKNLKEMMVYLVAYQGEEVKKYLEFKEDKKDKEDKEDKEDK